MAARFTKTMAAHVLEHDTNDGRFEEFCTELLRDVEGIEFVKTSATWDHGRDGIDASSRSGPIPPFICSTLRDDIVKKAAADIVRISEDCRPEVVFVCTSKKTSEHEVIAVENAIREVSPSVKTIRVHGQERIAQLSCRYPRAMEITYSSELAELRVILSHSSTISEEDSLVGLRVALTTQLNEDAQVRRSGLIDNLVLTALEKQSPQNRVSLVNTVSQLLHLPRSINSTSLSDRLESLADTGVIALDRDAYHLTDKGKEKLAEMERLASNRLAVGEAEIRAILEELCGTKIINSEWGIVWKIIQEGVSQLFLSHGMTVIEAVSSIMGTGSLAPHSTFSELLDRVAERISNLPGKPEHALELSQAFRDMFSEANSKAFRWLEDLCSVYVDACSLGLENRSQEQLLEVLRQLVLVLDTDAILSLLSEGDGNHQHVQNLIRDWIKIGGEAVAVLPVMEEASHHAWIADYDYNPNWRQMAKMTDVEASHLLENVFVRGFWKIANGDYTPKAWRQYISAFRGRADHDFDKLLGLLSDHGVRLVSVEGIDRDLANSLADALYRKRGSRKVSGGQEHAAKQKCSRDGRMIATLAAFRSKLAESSKTATIVSSGKGLRVAAAMYPDQLGEPEPVLYLSAIAWLLSLVPGIHLSEGALRGLLFDVIIRRRLPPLERHVMRVIQASSEHKFHWSRRNTLYRAARTQLSKMAFQRGQSVTEVEDIIESDSEEGKNLLVEVIASAIDARSVSRSEEENRMLHARVKELEEELAKKR